MRSLLRLLGARHAPFLAMSALLLGAFQFLICAAVASADVGGAIQTLMQSLPPLVQSVVATQVFGGLTVKGLLAFGWSHPIAHALGTAVAIVLAMRAIAGESETGAIELLLTQPLSRSGYFAAQVGFALVALAVVTAAGLAGTVIGQRVFGLERFGVLALGRLGLGYFLLQGAWYGITLLLSAFGREGGRVASVGFLIALTSYIANVIGALWQRAAFILPWTLHDYFSPRNLLMKGASMARPMAVLLVVMVASVVLAGWRFRQRDLP